MKKHAERTAAAEGITSYKGFIISRIHNGNPAAAWEALSDDGIDRATGHMASIAHSKARRKREYRLAAEELKCSPLELPTTKADLSRVLKAKRTGAPLGAHLARFRWLTGEEPRLESKTHRPHGI